MWCVLYVCVCVCVVCVCEYIKHQPDIKGDKRRGMGWLAVSSNMVTH